VFKKLNKQIKTLLIIITLVLLYFFIYKPYFTSKGRIWREVKHIQELEEKVLYYACGLPKEHKYHKILMKECNDLELRSKYESAQQDCSSDYMGGCN